MCDYDCLTFSLLARPVFLYLLAACCISQSVDTKLGMSGRHWQVPYNFDISSIELTPPFRMKRIVSQSKLVVKTTN